MFEHLPLGSCGPLVPPAIDLWELSMVEVSTERGDKGIQTGSLINLLVCVSSTQIILGHSECHEEKWTKAFL
jgi:hypothetical protein